MDPQRRQQERAGRHREDRGRLQRQPDQVQGRRAGLPAGLLQPVGGRRRGVEEAAVHPRHRRPERAQLGLGRLPGPAGRHGRHPVQVPAVRARQVERQDLLLRLLRRGAGHGDPQVDPGQVRHPGADHRPAVDQGRAGGGVDQDQGVGRLRLPAGPGHQLHRRVVALRVLAVPAELRRRPDQPRRLQDRRGRAQRAAGAGVGRVDARADHQRRHPVEVRHRPGQGLHQRQVRDPLQRHLDRGRHPEEVR